MSEASCWYMAHHVSSSPFPLVRVLRGLATAGPVAVALVIACSTSPDSKQTSNQTVDIFTVGDAFSPVFATVNAGDTVRWNFTGGSDGQGHNVRFTPAGAGAPADINVLKTGTASRVFPTRGTFNYVCDVHPGMNGSVTVQ
jgi:plastocyanin